MAKKKPIKKKSVVSKKKAPAKTKPRAAKVQKNKSNSPAPKRNIVRRVNKKGNTYFYNRRQGKIVPRDSWKKENKRIAKRKEAREKAEAIKVKKRIPRKGTKQYKEWLKRYRHLRKCSRVRSIAYELYPETFPTYASTAAFCKFFLKRKERATLKNIDAAFKEFAQTVVKPDIPERFFENWFWFETDFRMDELRQYVIDSLIPNLWIRSQLSSMPTFLINEYTYDSTFKAYVDWKNAHQDSNRDAGRDYTELLVSLNFNYKKARWEVFIEEEDNPGGEPYTEKLPFDVLVKEEPAETKGPIVARGGEEKTPQKQRKGKAKKIEQKERKKLTQSQREEINAEISNLEQIRESVNKGNKLLVEEMIRYKNAGEQELYLQTLSSLKEMRKEIDSLNRKIISLKTVANKGKI